MFSSRARNIFAGALCFAATLHAVPALAADPGPDALPISVLLVQTNDADEQADSLTKALRSAVHAMPGWSLADGDYSLEVITLQLKCDASDATCASRIADEIKADRYIWGTLKKKGASVAGGLHLWVRGKGSTSVPVEYAANLVEANDDALRKIASDAVTQLTGGPPKGSVHVKVGSIDGQVFVDNAPIGALAHGDGTYLVPTGSHHLTVKAPGYADVETTVTVHPTGTTEVSLTPAQATPSGPVDTRKVVAYASLGGGALFAIVGVVGALEVNGVKQSNEYSHYSGGVSSSQDPCTVAANGDTRGGVAAADVTPLCNKAHTFQAVQLVMYPLAAIAGGVGVYLLMTAPKTSEAPKQGLHVTPEVGLHGGRLQLTYDF